MRSSIAVERQREALLRLWVPRWPQWHWNRTARPLVPMGPIASIALSGNRTFFWCVSQNTLIRVIPFGRLCVSGNECNR